MSTKADDSDSGRQKAQRLLSGWLGFLIELAASVGIGLVLFFVLNLKDIAQVSWIVGGLLIWHRFVTELSIREGQEQIARLMNRLDVRVDSIDRAHQVLSLNQVDLTANIEVLSKYLNLRHSLPPGELKELVDSYQAVVQPELFTLRDSVVETAKGELTQLSRNGRSRTLQTTEYYDWLLPQLREVRSGTKIWAVSLMLNCEWDDSPEEKEFLELNLRAVERGATVERIFVCDSETWREALTQAFVRRQVAAGPNFTVRHVDREKVQKRDQSIVGLAGDGFIAFGKSIALVDEHSQDGTARGHVSMDADQIRHLDRIYARLSVASTVILPEDLP